MSEQKPTVGRAVHYYPREPSHCEPSYSQAPGPYAATITRVDGSTIVDLTVFPPSGPLVCGRVENVRWAEEPTPGSWSWPPRV